MFINVAANDLGCPQYYFLCPILNEFLRYQFSSVAESCPTLCYPTGYSTLSFPFHHQRLELTLTHVHHVNNAIQPSHPLPSPSSSAFNLSQHQGLFRWVSSLHQWPEYWSFSFSISPSNEYSGLSWSVVYNKILMHQYVNTIKYSY